MSADRITVRPVTAADRQHLLEVYAATRTEELRRTGWTEQQKAEFVLMQFEAQDRHYRAHYDGAQYLVIESAGTAAGRLYLHDGPAGLRIMDIALLPAWRGRGIGTALLQQLLAQAHSAGRAVSIHVEQFNPARRLYERLGFEPVSENGPYLLMEAQPKTAE